MYMYLEDLVFFLFFSIPTLGTYIQTGRYVHVILKRRAAASAIIDSGYLFTR